MHPVGLIQTIEILYLTLGYPIVFLGSFVEVTPIAWFFPAGLVVIAAGFYSYGSKILSLVGILVAGWLGEWLAFLAAYFLGYKKSGLIKILQQEKNARKAKKLLTRHGALILTTSMMAGLTRFWVAYIAGQQNYRFLKFLFFSGAASLTWTALMIAVGYLAGYERTSIEAALIRMGTLGWILLILAVVIIFWVVKKELGSSK